MLFRKILRVSAFIITSDLTKKREDKMSSNGMNHFFYINTRENKFNLRKQIKQPKINLFSLKVYDDSFDFKFPVVYIEAVGDATPRQSLQFVVRKIAKSTQTKSDDEKGRINRSTASTVFKAVSPSLDGAGV